MNAEKFNALDYAASVKHAILRSISHTEITYTPVPAEGRAEMINYLNQQDEIEDLDSSEKNDGGLDVWGTFDGENFRINFI